MHEAVHVTQRVLSRGYTHGNVTYGWQNYWSRQDAIINLYVMHRLTVCLSHSGHSLQLTISCGFIVLWYLGAEECLVCPQSRQ